MGVLLRDFMGKLGTMTGGAKSDQPTGDQRGAFAGLSEEQKAAALAYRGEENFGASCFLRKEEFEAYRAQKREGNRIAREEIERRGVKPHPRIAARSRSIEDCREPPVSDHQTGASPVETE